MSKQRKLALEKINEATCLFKEAWEMDTNNHKAEGCYKALNAIRQVLIDNDGKEKINDYPFVRFMEALACFAKYYGITLDKALEIAKKN